MKKICKFCKKEYECYDRPRKGRCHKLQSKSVIKYKRAFNSLTCSAKCSKAYNRRNQDNWYKNIKNENNVVK